MTKVINEYNARIKFIIQYTISLFVIWERNINVNFYYFLGCIINSDTLIIYIVTNTVTNIYIVSNIT